MLWSATIILVWVISYFSVWGVRYWTVRRKILDIPGVRSSHTRPTPRGGGLAIVVITLIGGGIFFALSEGHNERSLFLIYAIGGVLIAGISLLDDILGLSYRVRFGVQGIAALLAVWGIGLPPAVELLDLWWVFGVIAFLWIVGLTNAYNFMDGIDGLAGGQAVVAGIGWWVIGSWLGHPFISVLGFLVAFSSLGFLGHNWSPARIFMGDVGSAFLGYSFAVLSLVAAKIQVDLFFWGGLLVWPFIFDTIFTFVRRLVHRENVFQAHRSHLYQRLVICNISHQRVSILYIILAFLYGLMIFPFWGQWPGATLICVIGILSSSMGLWGVVRWIETHAI